MTVLPSLKAMLRIREFDQTLSNAPIANYESRLAKLTGDFDIVFVDANKDGYETYVKQILDQGLLSQDGIILCDNGKLLAFNLKMCSV